MASSPLDPAYNGQRIAQPFISKDPYYQAYPPDFGAYATTSASKQPPAIHNVDLVTRLAVLEKELEHCHAEKAEAEIAVQYLAHLNASNAAKQETPQQTEKQIINLKKKLLRTKEDKQKLQARLEKALSRIVFLLSAPSSQCKPIITSDQASTSQTLGTKKAAIETGDLIDLLGPDSNSTDVKAKQALTLLDRSCDDLSDNAEASQSWHTASELFTSDSSDSSYIFRFGNRADRCRSDNIETVATDVAKRKGIPSSSSKTDLHTSFATTSHNSVLDESSNDDFTLPNGPISPSTSFASDSIENTSSKLHVTKEKPCHLLKRTVSECHNGNPDVKSTSSQKPEFPHTPAAICPLQCIGENKNGLEDYDVASHAPRWKTLKVIDSNAERTHAIFINERSAGINDLRFPEFFNHDVRFVPGSSEQNIHRTIVISGLPINTSMKTLMNHIRGGAVFDAKLLDTLNITGAKTALVVFLDENAAFAYAEHANMQPITINNEVIQVSVVPTPTWPIPASLRKRINTLGYTRCFEVHNFPDEVSLETLKTKLGSLVLTTTHLESISIDENNVLELRFSSIGFAAHCSEMFTSKLHHRGCNLIWVPDPCAQPLDTLFQESIRPSASFEEDVVVPIVDIVDCSADTE